MTAVVLPSAPFPVSCKPRLLYFGGDMTPPLGGSQQRFERLGSRFGVDIVYLAMGVPFAEAFIAARLKARVTGSTVKLGWPQPAVGAVTAGAGALVNGASQTGLTLNAKSLGVGTIPAGSFFSFVGPSGINYLHFVTDAIAISSHTAALPIGPLIRESPADGAALNFVTPTIEGFIDGQNEEWQLDRLAWSTLSFTIKEAA